MLMKFPICSSSHLTPYHHLYDDRYGYPGSFQLLQCDTCRHKFIEDTFSSASLRELYTDYYPQSSIDIDKCKPCKEVKGIESWLNGEKCSVFRWVPKSVRILDIGCGFGQSLGYHRSRECEVYGVETDENIRRVADKYDFKVHVGLFNPDYYESNYFDYVTMDQVIEHVTNPLEILRGATKVLKPQGIVILGTPNSNGWGARLFGCRWINWHTPYHLQHFSSQSMRQAAEKTGLVIDRIRTITNSEWLYYQWMHLALPTRIGGASRFWTSINNYSRRDRRVLKILNRIHKAKINHLVTRIFDRLGIGDNYLFFLRKK